MARARYESNKAGLEELARSSMAQSIVQTYAEQKASAAGDGFVASYKQGRHRFVGIVYADTFSAMRREARDNILVRVLG